MDNKETIEKLVNKIIAEAKWLGIEVMRYDSKNTNSVYLKFDAGMLNSVRISDHRGYKKYAYRYNIILNIVPTIEIDRGFDRYYYNQNGVKDFIKKLETEYSKALKKYEGDYTKIMEKNKITNKDKRGFWAKGRIVWVKINCY